MRCAMFGCSLQRKGAQHKHVQACRQPQDCAHGLHYSRCNNIQVCTSHVPCIAMHLWA